MTMQTPNTMRIMRRHVMRPLMVALLAGAAVGCDKTLTVEPTTEVEESQAIIDAASARAALAGAYDALQSGSYYGGDFLFLSDLASDDVAHVGTFTTYADIDQHVTSADNSTLEGMWDAIYAGIGRANTLIAKVPNVTTLSEDERKDIVGQAHLLRALHYHNLVKLWGPVPIRLAPPSSLDELTGTERATVAQVYTQILTDINQAQQLISTDYRTREGSWLAAEALKTRVLLYQGSNASVITAANRVLDEGVELAPTFSSLFAARGTTRPRTSGAPRSRRRSTTWRGSTTCPRPWAAATRSHRRPRCGRHSSRATNDWHGASSSTAATAASAPSGARPKGPRTCTSSGWVKCSSTRPRRRSTRATWPVQWKRTTCSANGRAWRRIR
ncbi:MAG: RagB/SusD family nutrient uptake outer membrane protein [Gemmatimonadetes bacterium]|nr:RagB/SusD family nutrient uptake outer membrane protein [Gemmatimonadota bacterium]